MNVNGYMTGKCFPRAAKQVTFCGEREADETEVATVGLRRAQGNVSTSDTWAGHHLRMCARNGI